MRKINVVCLAAVLLTAGVASAVVWNPTDPNAIAAGYSNWNIAANWTTGILPDVQGTASFNVAGRPVCWVTGVQTVPFKFAMGDGGANGSSLAVKNGGSLSLGAGNGWNAVGYSKAATLTVEKGGFVTSAARVMVGRAGVAALAPSSVIVDGGTFEITAGALQMNESTGWGQLFVKNGGLVNIKASQINGGGTKMLIDVGFGTIIQNANQTTNLTTWKNSGQLVGFGGKGTVVFDYNVTNAGKTTLTAIHPMIPVPGYGSMVGEGTVALGWKNVDPNIPGQPVYVDVWFGTDPNKLSLAYTKVVTKGMNTTTVNVTAPVNGTPPTTYYWQVDSYIYGSPTGTPIASDVFKFNVTNDFPPTVVIDTPNMVTWANQPVQINATVSDTGTSALTIAWTSNPAGAVFSPSAAVEDPAVTANPATFPTTYTLTCSVKDAQSPTVTNTDTVQIVVYANACAAARRINAQGTPTATGLPRSDVDGNCVTEMADLVNLLNNSDWMADYTILAPTAF